jgi:SAM-dependent methyltransferase
VLLLPWLTRVLDELELSYEFLVITNDCDTETIEASSREGARVLLLASAGYGAALVEGFKQSCGEYILTLDADLSHRPEFVRDMWKSRNAVDILIASRYVAGGTASMPRTRLYLSRLLNLAFRRGLSMPLHDMSSGFRLYRRSMLAPQALTGTDFDVLEEILVKAFCEGWRVQEIPFDYMPREHGTSSMRVTALGRAYLRAFWSLWKLRNSIEAADYDHRAFDSPIPLQRYWQRARFRITSELTAGEGPVLDVGCGSSRIIGSLPEGSVALDILIRKLRFDRRFGVPLVAGSGFALPFPDASFSCVLSSQVIEHVPKDSPMIDELCRVLKPGGRLVLGTPDYARWEWVYVEKLYARVAPGAYADEHIAHYTRKELIELLRTKGLLHEETRYIARGELIMAFRRPLPPTAGP